MRIDVHFDSLKEFAQYMGICCAPVEPVRVWSEEPEPVTEVEEKPAEAGPAPAPAEEKPQLDESLRVEARKVLADLNKKTGKNTAKEILSRMGFASLNKAPLDQIPAIIANAREEAADAE